MWEHIPVGKPAKWTNVEQYVLTGTVYFHELTGLTILYTVTYNKMVVYNI